MTSTITQSLKTTFDLASLRHEANHLRRPEDWEKSRAIRDQFEQERKTQEKKYFESYEMRVDSVIKKLMDRGAAVSKEYKHRWFGNDAFDRKMLTTQAHRLVQQDHQRRLMMINDREAGELGALILQVKQRDALQEKPTQEFNRASDQWVHDRFHQLPTPEQTGPTVGPTRHR